ncbi:uncharacterized protein RJT21DRAFT_121682 [Scheffersomyces amazonensis]|uniref:uncharacterized protein n=1 Tax=Scheffersomyces amazonensis TaxID=1078765 RepID=UPI00315D161E
MSTPINNIQGQGTSLNIKQLIDKLTIEQLQPFPLPKYIDSLPNANIQEFIQNEELIKGYIKDLESYKLQQQKIVDRSSKLQSILKDDILGELLTKYLEIIQKIKSQLKSIHQIYQEFLNLETYQYQLLSSNFNQDYLIKTKFGKLIEKNNNDSIQLIKEYTSKIDESGKLDETEFNELITNFKRSRQLYHLRREKLHRFNEERVSGFI